MHRGFIKIWRKIEDWEWIDNPNVLVVWFHCLRLANIEDKKWHGTVIKKGSFVTSYQSLAKSSGLSVQQVRTALNKLRASELTIKTTNKYSVISVENYDDYNEVNKRITNKQQTNNKQITTTKEYKNIRSKKDTSIYTSMHTDGILDLIHKTENKKQKQGGLGETRKECEEFLKEFNRIRKTNYSTVEPILKNFTLWRKTYTVSQMIEAVKRAKNDPFSNEAISPTWLFRTRNKNGECDYIGDLLNTKTRMEEDLEDVRVL